MVGKAFFPPIMWSLFLRSVRRHSPEREASQQMVPEAEPIQEGADLLEEVQGDQDKAEEVEVNPEEVEVNPVEDLLEEGVQGHRDPNLGGREVLEEGVQEDLQEEDVEWVFPLREEEPIREDSSEISYSSFLIEMEVGLSP